MGEAEFAEADDDAEEGKASKERTSKKNKQLDTLLEEEEDEEEEDENEEEGNNLHNCLFSIPCIYHSLFCDVCTSIEDNKIILKSQTNKNKTYQFFDCLHSSYFYCFLSIFLSTNYLFFAQCVLYAFSLCRSD